MAVETSIEFLEKEIQKLSFQKKKAWININQAYTTESFSDVTGAYLWLSNLTAVELRLQKRLQSKLNALR